MICPKCHKVYEEGNVYCVDCGKRLVKERTKKIKQESPIERHSSRFKTSKPKTETETDEEITPQVKEITPDDNKLDILILQNRELIRQNNKIIELLEKLSS